MLFLGRGLELEVGRKGRIEFGRFVWIGDETKIRCHEGRVEIGSKTVMGQECTISAYQRVRIGEQCVIADRAMFIDFDHGVVEVERPIRLQGIYKRDVVVGSNVWIGYGACILRGVSVGDNSIVGTNSVVTKDVPANAVVAGIPARIIRMREAPQELRWPDPVEPDPEAWTTLRRQLRRAERSPGPAPAQALSRAQRAESEGPARGRRDADGHPRSRRSGRRRKLRAAARWRRIERTQVRSQGRAARRARPRP